MYYDLSGLFEIEVILSAIGALFITYKFEYFVTRFVTFLCCKISTTAASIAMGVIAGVSCSLVFEACVLEDLTDPFGWIAFGLYAVSIIPGCIVGYNKTMIKYYKKFKIERPLNLPSWVNK